MRGYITFGRATLRVALDFSWSVTPVKLPNQTGVYAFAFYCSEALESMPDGLVAQIGKGLTSWYRESPGLLQMLNAQSIGTTGLNILKKNPTT